MAVGERGGRKQYPTIELPTLQPMDAKALKIRPLSGTQRPGTGGEKSSMVSFDDEPVKWGFAPDLQDLATNSGTDSLLSDLEAPSAKSPSLTRQADALRAQAKSSGNRRARRQGRASASAEGAARAVPAPDTVSASSFLDSLATSKLQSISDEQGWGIRMIWGVAAPRFRPF